MKVRIENGYLLIPLKLVKAHPSTSGKSMVIGSTRGPRPTGLKLRGKVIRIIANAFYDREQPHKSK